MHSLIFSIVSLRLNLIISDFSGRLIRIAIDNKKAKKDEVAAHIEDGITTLVFCMSIKPVLCGDSLCWIQSD